MTKGNHSEARKKVRRGRGVKPWPGQRVYGKEADSKAKRRAGGLRAGRTRPNLDSMEVFVKWDRPERG